MQEAARQEAGRPTREQIEPAVRRLVERHAAQVMGTARRYSLSAEDAEDAFQRGLEILLTKAPSTHEDDLLPWLKTVVKHEAFAIRKQRQRAELTSDRELTPGLAPPTHEQAERQERLRLGAEAMSRLKPQEVRCLLLRAEGYSYKQICEETGFSYTKVNRCLTEGRKAFLEQVAGIESGAECKRLAPLLSRLADGEASAEDMALLRPHMRTCLSCRAALRQYRGAPARVAVLLPLAAGPHLLGRVLYRVQMLFLRAHDTVAHAADVATAQKVAAVAAATAALAGGGVATVASLEHGSHAPPPVRQHVRHHERHALSAVRAVPPSRPKPQPHHVEHPAVRKAVQPEQQQQQQQEFAPSPVSNAPSRPARAAAASGGEFGP
jgi:RNA polymerase sigma factor (sigma-70 family)